jgi:hypothetical protein
VKISISFFLLGVFLTPFYFFPSGGGQISDVCYIVSVLNFLTFNRNKVFSLTTIYPIFNPLKYFVIWTLLINFIYFIIWNDFLTLFSAVYYVYNFLLIVLLFGIYEFTKERFLRFLFITFFLSLFCVFLIAVLNLDYIFSKEISWRRSVTFNNPNQLGYWSLIVISLISILYKFKIAKSKMDHAILFLSIVMAFYISMISLSKASSISILLLIVFLSLRKIKLLVMVVVFAYSSLIFFGNTDDNFIGKYFKRIGSVGEANDDSLEGRNYDRITKYPEYIFFGAGEGAISQRFDKDNEIHSTFGTILFSYGLFGLFSFSYFLFEVYKKQKFNFLFLMMPMLAYSLTHMGLRFSFFWLSLGVFVLLTDKKRIIHLNKQYI